MCEPKDDTKRYVRGFVSVDEPEDLAKATEVLADWEKPEVPPDPSADLVTN